MWAWGAEGAFLVLRLRVAALSEEIVSGRQVFAPVSGPRPKGWACACSLNLHTSRCVTLLCSEEAEAYGGDLWLVCSGARAG